MKTLLAMLMICSVVFMAGCAGNNVGTSPSLPEAVKGAAGAGAQAAPEAPQFASESSGGSNLAAAAPYGNDGKSGAVQQNVNPSPFMTASSSMKPGMELPASAGALVSRADGTMYGPADMSPAGIGPGMEGPGSGGSTPNQTFRGAGTKSTAGATIPGKQTNKGATPK